jgi:hypothetical protein
MMQRINRSIAKTRKMSKVSNVRELRTPQLEELYPQVALKKYTELESRNKKLYNITPALK